MEPWPRKSQDRLPIIQTLFHLLRKMLKVQISQKAKSWFYYSKYCYRVPNSTWFFLRKKMCSLPVVRVWDILKNLGYNCKLFLIQKLVKTYQKHQFHVVVIIRKSFKMCNFITRCCPHPRNWRCVCFSLSLGRFRLRGVVGGGLCTLCTHHIYEPIMFTVGLPSRCTG